MPSRRYSFNNDFWVSEAGDLITSVITKALSSGSPISVFLPGGNTAASLYSSLNLLLANKGPIDFYLTDERLDVNSNKFSNAVFVSESMTDAIHCNGNQLNLFPRELSLYKEEFVESYLPDAPNVVILSLANDGHFASIFEYQETLVKMKKKHFIASCKKYPFDRISITPAYINSAQYTFLLAPGKIKQDIIDREMKVGPLRMIDNYILVTTH